MNNYNSINGGYCSGPENNGIIQKIGKLAERFKNGVAEAKRLNLVSALSELEKVLAELHSKQIVTRAGVSKALKYVKRAVDLALPPSRKRHEEAAGEITALAEQLVEAYEIIKHSQQQGDLTVLHENFDYAYSKNVGIKNLRVGLARFLDARKPKQPYEDFSVRWGPSDVYRAKDFFGLVSEKVDFSD